MPRLSVQQLFDERREKLELTWMGGHQGGGRELAQDALKRPGVGLVGHLNLVHPMIMQTLGKSDVEYLDSLTKRSREESLYTLFSGETLCVFICDGTDPPAYLVDAANRHGTALIGSRQKSRVFVNLLRSYLQRELSEVTTMHGVFLDVLGIGVIICGDSSIGKSELALELVSRGAGLVADDVVELYQIGPDLLQGRCPPLLRDLGVLNIRLIFGETAVRPTKTLKLIVRLERPTEEMNHRVDRLAASAGTETIHGIDIPSVTLAVVAGRNLAVLVEAAVRNYILQTRGYDSSKEFIERHEAAMHPDEEGGGQTDAPAYGAFGIE
jgi:HPr kinase/phosphorylase